MSKIVPLDYPVDLDGGHKLTSLTFRRVTADDAEIIQPITNGVTKIKKLIELTGSNTSDPSLPLSPRLIGKIDLLDLGKIEEELEPFLHRGRKAGSNS